jgi:hypothetical protein
VQPTALPTVEPSAQPSSEPTHFPTKSSGKPTSKDNMYTSSPSKQRKPGAPTILPTFSSLASFDVLQEVEYLNADYFSNSTCAQTSFIEAVSNSMNGVPVSDIKIVSSVFASTSTANDNITDILYTVLFSAANSFDVNATLSILMNELTLSVACGNMTNSFRYFLDVNQCPSIFNNAEIKKPPKFEGFTVKTKSPSLAVTLLPTLQQQSQSSDSNGLSNATSVIAISVTIPLLAILILALYLIYRRSHKDQERALLAWLRKGATFHRTEKKSNSSTNIENPIHEESEDKNPYAQYTMDEKTRNVLRTSSVQRTAHI